MEINWTLNYVTNMLLKSILYRNATWFCGVGRITTYSVIYLYLVFH